MRRAPPRRADDDEPTRSTISAERFLRHSYTDRLHEPPSTNGRAQDSNERSRVSTAFPGLLYFILQNSEAEGFSGLISWQPHGRSFRIHDQNGFSEQVMMKYFDQSKYASFQRQLNVYGFTKLARGKDRGGYYHEYFLRSRPDLLAKVKRQSIKGRGTRKMPVHDTEPDFYTMPFCSAAPVTGSEEFAVEDEEECATEVDEDTTAEDGEPIRLPEPLLFPFDGTIAENGVPDEGDHYRVRTLSEELLKSDGDQDGDDPDLADSKPAARDLFFAEI